MRSSTFSAADVTSPHRSARLGSSPRPRSRRVEYVVVAVPAAVAIAALGALGYTVKKKARRQSSDDVKNIRRDH